MRLSSVAVAVSLAACTTPAPIANPQGLPPEALSLQYVLGDACLPHAMGQKTERQAFGGIGLRYSTLDIGLVGPNGPIWLSRYPGIRAVNASPYGCYFTVSGPDVETYKAVLFRLLRDRIGADPEADARRSPDSLVRLQGYVTGCSRGVRYYYTPLAARVSSGELANPIFKKPGLEISADAHNCEAASK